MRRALRVIAVVGSLSLVVAACSSEEPGTGGTTGTKEGGTFVFGASSDPISLDGAYVSDGESIRIVYQIFEGLVATEDGGFTPVPRLAKSWTTSDDGKVWTFKLQENVTFHDGEAFNAEAVCFNFNRWYNFKGLAQSDSVSYYWITVFGGFSDGKTPSLYKSCAAPDPTTAVITLNSGSASFLAALSLPSFSIASPKALTTYEADKISGTADSPSFDGTYGLQHPTGTGPYKFKSFTANDRVVLEKNTAYWGPDKPKFDQLIFRPIANAPDRKQALQTNEIHAFENPDPGDIQSLKDAGFTVAEREPFNVGYIGFNQSKKPFDNLKIRQAIAHAINKQALLTAKYPPGAIPAQEFMPPGLSGYEESVTKYDYDPAKAKRLIQESGVTDLTLEFWYPTDISRGYMPDPAANFQAFKSDLEAVGFKITPKSAPWRPDYNNTLQSGTAPMYLYGWLADFGDADNFIGVFFQQYTAQFGFRDAALFDLLNRAEAETDEAAREGLYKEANKKIMDMVPGVPYVHTKTFVILAKNVTGFKPSPINLERYSLMGFTS